MSTIERGQILSDRFLLLQLLGRGGLGEAWLAEDPILGEQVVLKLWPGTLGQLSLDQLEARQRESLRLEHPALLHPHEFFQSDELRFVSMRYFPGGNLTHLALDEPLQIARMLAEITDALATAHANGMAHGNLHAGNLLLDPAGGPHVVDFGTVRNLDSLERKARPVDDLVALSEIVTLLIRGFEFSTHGSSHSTQALREIAEQLSTSPEDSNASRTAAVHARFVEIAETRTAPPHEDTIQPVPVRSASHETHPPQPPEKEAASAPRNLILGAFGLLLVVAIAVFTLLPGIVEQEAPTPAEKSDVPRTPVIDEKPEIEPIAESAAPSWNPEDARTLFDTRVAALEERGAEDWGALHLESARRHRDKAKEHLEQEQFVPAREQYEEALLQLDALDPIAKQEVEEAIAKASSSLDAHDITSAEKFYAYALRIDPDNPDIERAKERLAVANDVFTRLQEAAREEAEGEIEAARSSVLAALELDPNRESAKRTLARLDAELDQRRFNVEMSKGLSDMAAGRISSAQDAFSRAQAIRPEAPEPADGLAQAAETRRTVALRGFERSARRAEEQEDYAAALKDYQAALRIEPHLFFARQGQRRNVVLAGIHQKLTRLLADRSRLESPEVQKEATVLLALMDEQPSLGPKLKADRDQLVQWLAVAETPLPVIFQSDAQTQVVVYKVGALGKFLQRELPLPPGTYTVVGSRDGYRDVRRTVTVVPGRRLAPVIIRCEEPL